MANVKNYHEQGGKRWVVRGELELAEGGRLLFNGSELKSAGGLTDLAPGATVTPAQYNALLAALYAAGLMVADKADLGNAILAAEEMLATALVGDWEGCYPQAAYDAFGAAIATAKAVLDTVGISQTEVNAAKDALESAVSTFESAVVTVDKSTLASTLASARGILDSAEVGNWDGAYPQEACNTFSAAIGAAQAVHDDARANQSQVDAADSALGAAATVFQGAVIVVSKTALGTAITAAETLLNGAAVGSEQGEYPQEDYDAFSGAIDAARAVYDDAKASQDDVEAAEADLGEARADFEGSVITE